jgi:hypothetical protein
MIILNEETKIDEVKEALKSFIEAANTSDQPYTIEDLQEMVEISILAEGTLAKKSMLQMEINIDLQKALQNL